MNTISKVLSSLAIAALVLAASVMNASAGRIAPEPFAPGAFGKLSPAVMATNVPVYATLKWNASIGATGYRYCVDTSNNSTCNTAWVDTTATQVTLSTPLAQNTTYYWQASAVNADGEVLADGNTWWYFSTGSLPAAFTKSFPGNNASNLATSVTIGWASSAGADRYEYCYSTSSAECTGPWVNNNLATTAVISGLAWNTQYIWQVRAVNAVGVMNADDGAHRFFRTADYPAAVNKTTPSNGAANLATSITLSWSGTTTATGYRYCYDQSNNNACDTAWVDAGNTTNASISGLALGTAYYWQVQSYNPRGSTNADSGFWFVFTTTPPAPTAFSKISPAPNSVNQNNALTLTWNAPSNAGAYSTTYQYCYAVSQAACTTWNNAGSSTQAAISGLADGATYYWQVRAINDGGTTYADANSYWSFTVSAYPAAFNKTSPSNGASNQPTSVTLTWNSTTGASSYEYCYDMLGDGNCAAWVSTGTNTSVVLNGLTKGKTYYWQVRAKAGSKYTQANNGAYWSFIVPSDPQAFSKTYPISGTSGIVVSQIQLDWGASANAVSYEYCFDSTIDNACSTAWTSAGSNLYTVITVASNLNYEWQVRAVNAANTMNANGGTWWTFSTKVLPGAFAKNSPANNASGVSASPTLIWSASAGAASYDYCLSTSASCTSWTANGTATSKALTGLTPGTKYYWRVRANNANGSTLADSAGAIEWSFTVAIGPFNKSIPANGATGISTSPTLTWSASAGAVLYEYCLATAAPCTAWTSNGTSTTKAISGLTAGTKYYWQVRAKDSAGTYVYADANAEWNFTTAIGTFNKSIPANGATGISTSPTLTWSASAGAVLYEYCLATAAPCTAWTSNGTSTTKAISGLTAGTKYYWQVRAKDSTGAYSYADASAEWNFTTGTVVSGSFSKISPVNGATGQPTTLTLTWGTSSGATGYDYCFDKVNNGTCDSVWNSTTGTSAAITLSSGTTYYWQVRAKSGATTTQANDGTWWSFVTKSTTTGKFSKVSPKSGAVNQPLKPTLTWNSYLAAKAYYYCYDTTNNNACDTKWIAVSVKNTSVTLPALLPGKTYYWQVYAATKSGNINANGATGWWSFKTGSKPGSFGKLSPVDGAIGIDADRSITLSWTSSARAERYLYCIDTNYDSVCSSEWIDVGAQTAVVITGLEPDTSYNWIVRSVNSFGTTYADLAWWSFHTLDTFDDIDGTISFDAWHQKIASGATDDMYYASGLLDSKITFTTPAANSIIIDTYVGPDQGIGILCIDAACQNVDFYAAGAAFTPIEFSGLANTAHTVTLTVTGDHNSLSTGNEIRFDGFKAAGLVYPNLDSTIQYGRWKAVASASALSGYYHTAAIRDAKVSFHITGSGFGLITAKGPSYGMIDVYVDGAHHSFYDLYSAATIWQSEIEITGLGAGDHLIEIVVREDKNPSSSGTGGVVIDGYKSY